MAPSAALLAAAVLLPLGVAAQQLPWQQRTGAGGAKEQVHYEYPEQVQLTAGAAPRVVDLHFRIRDGLHIQSHAPLDKGAVRTELVVAEPPGITVEAVTFPEGEAYASRAFPGVKLSVYTGEIVLHARLQASRPGEQMLNAALRYQACDADACYPPRNAPVALDVVAK